MHTSLSGDDVSSAHTLASESEEESEGGCGLCECALNGKVLLCAAVLLVGLGVFGTLSLAAVPPLSYGIKYNRFTKVAITDVVHDCGRYAIGPWNTFLLFPASVQTIEFTSDDRLLQSGQRYEPLNSRTKEGLALHMQISLQYQLNKESIGLLYKQFNQLYEQTFISTMRDILIKAASEFDAVQFWEERVSVGARMQSMVNSALSETYATCWGLQLMVIELPDLYEASIVRTQVQKQSIATRKNEQDATQIRAQTSVIQAEYDRRVKVTTAVGKANYTFVTKSAEASARQKTIDVEGQILHSISSNLTLEPSQLVTYQKYIAYQAMEESMMFFGFDDPPNGNDARRLSVMVNAAAPTGRAGAPSSLVASNSPKAFLRSRLLKDVSPPSSFGNMALSEL